MKISLNKLLKKVAVGIVGFIVLVLVLLYALPKVFPDTITNEIKKLAEQNLEGKLNFSGSELSFYNRFPSLTLTLDSVSLKGAKPFEQLPLVTAKTVDCGINLYDLVFKKKITVDGIYLNKADIAVWVTPQGEANYNIYKSNATTPNQSQETDNTTVNLENIIIENSTLSYHDYATGIAITSNNVNYKGKGDLANANFTLFTSASFNDFTFAYDGVPYVLQKDIKGKLVTKINTNTLSFVFEENDLLINKLPVYFKGSMDFLEEGYHFDFHVDSKKGELKELFSAFPPEYIKWLAKTEIKGKADAHFTFEGDYIPSKNTFPDIQFGLTVEDGYIKHEKATYPTENLNINLQLEMPNMDVNQFTVNLDTLNLKVSNDYLRAKVFTKSSTDAIEVQANVQAQLDLGGLHKSLGIDGFTVDGKLAMNMQANGTYNSATKTYPKSTGTLRLINGSVLTANYPNPIENIQVEALLNNTSATLSEATFTIPKATFSLDDQPFTVTASFANFTDLAYDISANGTLDVNKLYKVFHQEGLEVDGKIVANMHLKGKQSDAAAGRYNQLHNSGSLQLSNIKTTSTYLAKPFVIKSGTFSFNQNTMQFSNFKGKLGTSDVTMNGALENVINYVLFDDEKLKGNFKLTAEHIDVNEFMPATQTETKSLVLEEGKTTPTITVQTTTTQDGVIMIPQDFTMQISANAKQVVYDDMHIENLKGNVVLTNGTIALQKAMFDLAGAHTTIDATYANNGNQLANFDFALNTQDFDIKRVYDEVKMFRELATAAKDIEGIVALDYKLSGVLDHHMQPVMPSLAGGGVLSLKAIKVKNMKLLNVVSKKTETSAFNDPDLSEIDITSAIKNNIITVDRFKFKSSGFRLRVEGQTSFDEQINFKLRLGLPPLGIIGIPIKATGTMDNPVVKLGKKTKDLEGIEYSEEELLQLQQQENTVNDSIQNTKQLPVLLKPADSLQPTKVIDSLPKL